eukprot:scaffold668999_cov45-Prasinocladus_malaysianus.AAC.1
MNDKTTNSCGYGDGPLKQFPVGGFINCTVSCHFMYEDPEVIGITCYRAQKMGLLEGLWSKRIRPERMSNI